MGQTSSNIKESEDYQLIEELAVGNIVKHSKSETLHFLKEYSFTAQDTYQNALNSYSLKLAHKNEHVLNFLHFTTKSENSFCSTFHKIILIFEYIDYSLEKEIQNRIKNKRPFNEKEMWSVLCSCVLAAVHLINNDGIMHCGLTPKDIRLNPSGCVKLLNQEMIGIQTNHVQNEGVPKTLALTLLECMLMEKLTNEDNSYLEETINEGIECSRDMKEILLMMIDKNCKFPQLEEYLCKLVQDDDSLASHSNTPMMKSESLLSSNYKCPRIYRNENETKKEIKNSVILSLSADNEDINSYLFIVDHKSNEIELPDDNEDENELDNDEFTNESPKQVNSFFLKERKIETNSQVPEITSFNTFAEKDTKLAPIRQLNQTNQYFKLSEPIKTYHLESIIPIRATEPNINVLAPPNKNNESLFTDPELFSKIRNDLEEIKMRRSIGSVAKYEHVQASILKSENEATHINMQNNENLDKRIENFSTACFPSNLVNPQSNQLKKEEESLAYEEISKTIEQIEVKKETIQNFDEKKIEKRQLAETTEQKQPMENNLINNIMNDPDVGFKKKKEITNRANSEKENTLLTEKQDIVCPDILEKKSARSNKKEEKVENKSRTVGMKPIHPNQLSTFPYKDELFDDYSQSNSQSSKHITNRIPENDNEKLVHVNEKYNRGRYEGTKLNGKRHGHGTFYYIEGGKYVGNWKENKMNGKGVLYYPNQQVAYDGEWENDQLSGYGTLYNEEVTPLRNPFDYRDWGEVEDYWVKYEGNFSQDNKEGEGKLYLVNGERFEGLFHEDKVDGEGVLYREGNSVSGKWRENKLIRIF